jgi:imidazolonepropionase-like amidohydrolase
VVEANLPIVKAALSRFARAGGRVVVGTDAGIAPAKPHNVLTYSPADLLDMGFDGVEILTTLTSRAADVCGIGDRKGRLARGYDADVIAVAGDVVANPLALHEVRAVCKGGEMRDLSA